MTEVLLRRRPLPGGITLSCRETPVAEGRPRVLLLHGFPEAAFVWDGVMQALGGRAACVAPNLRGYADSSAPAELSAYRARALVGDIVALIQDLGAPVDLLVAHDWGGALAWNLAAAEPSLLRRLLILNSPHPATFLRELQGNPAQQAASRYMNGFCEPDAARRLAADDYAALWPIFGESPAWLTEAERVRYRQAWSQGLDGPLNYYRASPLRPPLAADDPLFSLQLPAAVTDVAVPTSVLWGLADHALLPCLLDGLQRWVPQLTVRRIAGASHWLVHESPQAVVAEIERCLGLDG